MKEASSIRQPRRPKWPCQAVTRFQEQDADPNPKASGNQDGFPSHRQASRASMGTQKTRAPTIAKNPEERMMEPIRSGLNRGRRGGDQRARRNHDLRLKYCTTSPGEAQEPGNVAFHASYTDPILEDFPAFAESGRYEKIPRRYPQREQKKMSIRHKNPP